jgi:thiaminase/transcriptional activator TenA
MGKAARILGFGELRAKNPGLRFTSWMRAKAEPVWLQCVRHRFMREMTEGTLSEQAFKRYLVQEYAFVQACSGVLGYAIVRSPGVAERHRFAGMALDLTGIQTRYFQRMLKRYGLSPDAVTPESISGAPRAFAEWMLQNGASGGYAEILAALIGAEWMYYTWCRAGAQHLPTKPAYAHWIRLHAGGSFKKNVFWMLKQLDQLGQTLGEEAQGGLAHVFREVLEWEVAFHDAVYAE